MTEAIWYDKSGQPISCYEWAARYRDTGARLVARTRTKNHTISTVLVGVDHRRASDPGPPLIFETMVFPQDCSRMVTEGSYTTEAEALFGHKRAVEKFGGTFYIVIEHADDEQKQEVIEI